MNLLANRTLEHLSSPLLILKGQCGQSACGASGMLEPGESEPVLVETKEGPTWMGSIDSAMRIRVR
jgi:hypothetical protein